MRLSIHYNSSSILKRQPANLTTSQNFIKQNKFKFSPSLMISVNSSVKTGLVIEAAPLFCQCFAKDIVNSLITQDVKFLTTSKTIFGECDFKTL